VDNRSAGGVTLLLDDSGKCLGATWKKSGHNIIKRHPTNDFALEGWKVPFHGEIFELAMTLDKINQFRT